MRHYFLGIDPGQAGALAVIDHGGTCCRVEDMPSTPHDVAAFVRSMLAALPSGGVYAVLERAQPMPKQGVSSSFNYGRGFGCLEGILVAHCVPYELVPPRVWKRGLGLDSDKEKARAMAQRLFPDAELERKKDHGRAEALLIAEWYRRREARA